MDNKKKEYTTEEQIFILADLTKRFGGLHELHVTNLKMWPLAYLNVCYSEAEYHHDTRHIYFTVGDPVGAVPADLKDRLVFLEKSCRYLLGQDINISVRTHNGYVIYGSFAKYPKADA
jgi:hypothetical protein